MAGRAETGQSDYFKVRLCELILHVSEEPWAADYSAGPRLARGLRPLPLQSFRPH